MTAQAQRLFDRLAGHQTAATGGALWLALTVAILTLMPAATPRPVVVEYLLLLGGVLILSLRFRIGFAVIGALFLTGVGLRLAAIGVGYSDVLPVTQLAIARMLEGLNPYGLGYPNSVPPGASFAYGPLSLLWYLPFRSEPRRLEIVVSCLILAVLALRGRPLGLALYAVTPILVNTASDGSNDTSAGLLLLVALLAAQRSAVAGGVLLAAAIAFKPYAAAWVPPLLAFGGLRALAGLAAGTAMLWGPAVLAWGVPSIVRSFRLAEAIHTTPYYSLPYALAKGDPTHVSRDFFDGLRVLAGVVTSLVSWPFVRSARSMIGAGIAIYLVTLFAGFWASFAYVAALAPLACWHIDDWVGLGQGRVRWPADPVGRLAALVDARWPLLART